MADPLVPCNLLCNRVGEMLLVNQTVPGISLADLATLYVDTLIRSSTRF